MGAEAELIDRLHDRRSKRVVFLSHCILNENTRYLGGALRAGAVREVVESCLDQELGIVQIPCPEQQAWGGVLKRRLLAFYGARGTLRYRLRRLLLPFMVFCTKRVYRNLARDIAGQIADYQRSGFTVVGIVGVDGSPSCGVNKTLDLESSFDLLAGLDIGTVTPEKVNAIVRQCLVNGRGLFSDLLQVELAKRGLRIPFLAHDLIAEIEGRPVKSQASAFPKT